MAKIKLIIGVAIVLIIIFVIIYFTVIKKKSGGSIDVGGICTGNGDCKNGACGVDEIDGELICCPSGKVVTIDGENYCSDIQNGEVCLDDAVCRSGYCKGVTDTNEGICSIVSPIPPEPECSSTVPCLDPTKRCLNSVCVPIPPPGPECSSTVPCRDPNKICIDSVCIVPEPDPLRPCSVTNPIGKCAGTNICDEFGHCITDTDYKRRYALTSGNRLYAGNYIKSRNNWYVLKQESNATACLYENDGEGQLIKKSCRGVSIGDAPVVSWLEMKVNGDLCGQYSTESGGKATDITCYYRNSTKRSGAFFVAVTDVGKVNIYDGVTGDISKSTFIYDLGF